MLPGNPDFWRKKQPAGMLPGNPLFLEKNGGHATRKIQVFLEKKTVVAVEPGGVRGCLRCRWVLSGWIFGWWGHLVPRLGQTIAQAELRRLPGSGGSWLAWVGWHRPSRVSPQLRLTPPQLASAPSDTSRDSQFESASSKCEPPQGGGLLAVLWPQGGFIGQTMVIARRVTLSNLV